MLDEVMGLICANYNTDRLGALTEDRPLASLPYGSRYRLIDFVLSNMVNAGIRTVGVVMPYMYRSMLDHLGAGKSWFLDRKLGGMFILPGSIYGFRHMSTQFLVKDMIRNLDYLVRDSKEYVVLTTANQIYNMDYKRFIEAHANSAADVTLVYRSENPAKRARGLFLDLNFEKRVTKMVLVRRGQTNEEAPPPALFADCLIIRREQLVDLIGWYQAVDHMDLLDVLSENLGNLQVYGYEFNGYLGRVDSIDSYLRCSMEALMPENQDELFYGRRPVLTKVRDGVPTRYCKSSNVTNSLVPNECTIKGRVENSILFPGVLVEADAVVKNSVIMQRGVVNRNAVVENVIADKFVNIGEGAIIMGSHDHPLVLKKRSAM
ncbi:MAG: glucose-1-phosphate adenylyltransferase subunit GlgD [Clostridiales Family XIII bacterium]|jgi:glucose-1-phosphate adenylyltransferase|nr:glucose-1-phosphate adenylyltransferase subunit GlgD [Clostridiales Family XIII bacterium]